MAFEVQESKKNENQIMAEQISMRIIMRIRHIIQEISKYSKYILENNKITVQQGSKAGTP